jgi:predicted AlkP superfamily pyrophosphatase or phosphodiesterase
MSLVLALPVALPALLSGGARPATAADQARRAPGPTKVLIVTLDSVGSRALALAGPERAPTLHRLMAEGASTRNARTVREETWTLPNHTTIVTGRRVDADLSGHGVYWNDERTDPATVSEAAGRDVSSVFRVVHSDVRDTGLFVSKEKLRLFKRSWPAAIDRVVLEGDNPLLVRKARRDLVEHRRALTFVHLSGPDDAGHADGFLGPEHLAAVEEADRLLGRLVAAIEARPRLRRHLTVIVTADHGGSSEGHGDPTALVNFKIPFVVWGAGVKAGANLYRLNDDYRNPGTHRTRYGVRRPPVRNGDAANLATDLLGLPAVEGSQFNADQSLDVR